jgi:hypothetical protein
VAIIHPMTSMTRPDSFSVPTLDPGPAAGVTEREGAGEMLMDCGRNPQKSADSGKAASYQGAGSSLGDT